MRKGFWQNLLAAVALCLPLVASAQLQEGKDYIAVKPAQPVETGKNIEVIEFFSYGCPHCHELEPKLTPWVKALPSDVTFRRVPVAFRDSWVPMAKVYFALEALGEADKLSPAFFHAVHKENLNTADAEKIADWAASKGIDRKKFTEMYASFSILTKLAKAKKATLDYQIDGVPTLVVDGKFRIPSNGGHDQMLAAATKLIDLARQQRGK